MEAAFLIGGKIIRKFLMASNAVSQAYSERPSGAITQADLRIVGRCAGFDSQ
jgi:hypothetical protein